MHDDTLKSAMDLNNNTPPAPDPSKAWVWDTSTDRVTLTEYGAQCFGLPPSGTLTWSSLRALILPEDLVHVGPVVDRARAEGAEYSVEFRIVRPDGKELWLAEHAIHVPGRNGAGPSMIGLIRDVTERRRAEELRLRLAAIVESSDDAIISKSLDGIIRSWNAGAERMFGYSPEEMIGRSVLTLIPDDRYEEERQILSTLMAGKRIDHYETIRRKKNGTQFHVSLTVSPVVDDQGRIVGASKIARDITARRRSEEALREESHALNLLNETGRAIAADLDRDSLIQRVTDAALALSGAQYGAFFHDAPDENGDLHQVYAVSGASPEAFAEFPHPRATALLGSTVRGGAPIRSDDIHADPRYGQAGAQSGIPTCLASVRSYLAVSVVSRSGEMLGFLLLGHDHPAVFTQRAQDLIVGVAAQAATALDNSRLYERVRRSAEERQSLLEAERAARVAAERISLMKDEFLATLSHELRTPLNAILGWAQVLELDTSASRSVLDGVAIIKRNAKAQAQLIEDLLDMSRIISGKIRLDVQKVDPHEIVKGVIETVRHSAEVKQIRLQAMLDSVAGPVWGDPNRLQQCVWNLLSNAIKFTPKGGLVRVSLARVNSHIELSVSDTGQGIEPEFLPHVFEKFRQADSSTTRTHGGLGLGLSIVRSLIELHGGNVRVSSAGKDKGSTFFLDLPLMVVGSEVAPADPGDDSDADEHSLVGVTLVVVDDEPDARALVHRVLTNSGAVVHLAESAREGLALVREKRPHMLISDIGMPDEDGYEFIRKLRRLRPDEGGKTPALALSAFARAEDRTRSLRAGYQAHVAKPVDMAELVALVASLATGR